MQPPEIRARCCLRALTAMDGKMAVALRRVPR